jgi:hypothetical protein
MLKVFLLVFAENENVIKVNENKRAGTENSIHEALKRLGCIFEAERHEFEFKKSKRSNYCRFRDILSIHWNLIIALFQI